MSSNQNSSGASSNPIYTEVVTVSRLLKPWCRGEECKKIIEEKKAIDDDIISIEYSESDQPKYLPHFSLSINRFIIKSKIETSAKLMKGVFEKLLDLQGTLTKKEKDINNEDRKISNQLYGMKQVEFHVESDLMGYVLGKRFQNISEVKKQTGVESIVVDDYMSIIRIIGKDLKCCNLAREKLEVVEKTITFPDEYTGLLVGSKGRNVREYISKSNVYRIQFQTGNAKIIGTKKSVNYAESLIMDDVNYYKKENELREKEDALYNKKLQFSTVKYNINNKNDKYYQYYDMYVNDGVIVHQPEPRFRGYIPNNNNNNRATTTTSVTNNNNNNNNYNRRVDEERKVEINVKENKNDKASAAIIQPTPVYRGHDSNGDVDGGDKEEEERGKESDKKVDNEEREGEYNRRGRNRGGFNNNRGFRGGFRGRDNYYNYNNRNNNDNSEKRGVTIREKFQKNK